MHDDNNVSSTIKKLYAFENSEDDENIDDNTDPLEQVSSILF